MASVVQPGILWFFIYLRSLFPISPHHSHILPIKLFPLASADELTVACREDMARWLGKETSAGKLIEYIEKTESHHTRPCLVCRDCILLRLYLSSYLFLRLLLPLVAGDQTKKTAASGADANIRSNFDISVN